MSATEGSPLGACGTDDEPYESAREEPDNPSIKLLEYNIGMSLSSETGSKDDTADDSDDPWHTMTSNKECHCWQAK